MDKMEWALWSLDYLNKARTAGHNDFNGAMEEVRGYAHMRQESWYSSCKNIVSTLYHYSAEFAADTTIPNDQFASPDVFEARITEYQAFVDEMLAELERENEKYQAENDVDGPPFLLSITHRQVSNVKSAVDYVASKNPVLSIADPVRSDVELIVGLARRFHEAVLSMRHHPHAGQVLAVNDEWDCQYLFRAILVAYIADIRDEEWNPSVAGTSSRCEFYIKSLQTMLELKFVRKASDKKKIKGELAIDFVDYGNNPSVDRVICLVYDPECKLQNPVAIQTDLSGPRQGIQRVDVVISPPRD